MPEIPFSRIDISIHALREEGDFPYHCETLLGEKFLSTPSARRATLQQFAAFPYHCISIHALREEGDAAPSW